MLLPKQEMVVYEQYAEADTSEGRRNNILIIYHNYAKLYTKREVIELKMIRPVSDLRNNFADISRIVHETEQPVFLTKNGYGDMVVLSMEAFEKLQFESEVYFKLQEAEREAEINKERFSSKDILRDMRLVIGGEDVI